LVDFGAGVVGVVVPGSLPDLLVRSLPARLPFLGMRDAVLGGFLGRTFFGRDLRFVAVGLLELPGAGFDAGGSAPRVHTPTSVARSIRARIRE
jgi:hypothetical protein